MRVKRSGVTSAVVSGRKEVDHLGFTPESTQCAHEHRLAAMQLVVSREIFKKTQLFFDFRNSSPETFEVGKQHDIPATFHILLFWLFNEHWIPRTHQFP